MFDKPTTGLDISAQYDLHDIMEQATKRGHTLLIITHHVEEVLRCIDHIVMLKKGKIFRSGSINECLTDQNISELFGENLYIEQDDYGTMHFHRRS
jgi:iron complex transport system ATP-binding protein